jgi:hypothetical protein
MILKGLHGSNEIELSTVIFLLWQEDVTWLKVMRGALKVFP